MHWIPVNVMEGNRGEEVFCIIMTESLLVGFAPGLQPLQVTVLRFFFPPLVLQES